MPLPRRVEPPNEVTLEQTILASLERLRAGAADGWDECLRSSELVRLLRKLVDRLTHDYLFGAAYAWEASSDTRFRTRLSRIMYPRGCLIARLRREVERMTQGEWLLADRSTHLEVRAVLDGLDELLIAEVQANGQFKGPVQRWPRITDPNGAVGGGDRHPPELVGGRVA